MSKRHALRELKRQKMAARDGYNMHLLDLWFAGAEIPAYGTRWYRDQLKRQKMRAVTNRP